MFACLHLFGIFFISALSIREISEPCYIKLSAIRRYAPVAAKHKSSIVVLYWPVVITQRRRRRRSYCVKSEIAWVIAPQVPA